MIGSGSIAPNKRDGERDFAEPVGPLDIDVGRSLQEFLEEPDEDEGRYGTLCGVSPTSNRKTHVPPSLSGSAFSSEPSTNW